MQDFDAVKQENPLNRHREQTVLPWRRVNKQAQPCQVATRWQVWPRLEVASCSIPGAGSAPAPATRGGTPRRSCADGQQLWSRSFSLATAGYHGRWSPTRQTGHLLSPSGLHLALQRAAKWGLSAISFVLFFLLLVPVRPAPRKPLHSDWPTNFSSFWVCCFSFTQNNLQFGINQLKGHLATQSFQKLNPNKCDTVVFLTCVSQSNQIRCLLLLLQFTSQVYAAKIRHNQHHLWLQGMGWWKSNFSFYFFVDTIFTLLSSMTASRYLW